MRRAPPEGAAVEAEAQGDVEGIEGVDYDIVFEDPQNPCQELIDEEERSDATRNDRGPVSVVKVSCDGEVGSLTIKRDGEEFFWQTKQCKVPLDPGSYTGCVSINTGGAVDEFFINVRGPGSQLFSFDTGIYETKAGRPSPTKLFRKGDGFQKLVDVVVQDEASAREDMRTSRLAEDFEESTHDFDELDDDAQREFVTSSIPKLDEATLEKIASRGRGRAALIQLGIALSDLTLSQELAQYASTFAVGGDDIKFLLDPSTMLADLARAKLGVSEQTQEAIRAIGKFSVGRQAGKALDHLPPELRDAAVGAAALSGQKSDEELLKRISQALVRTGPPPAHDFPVARGLRGSRSQWAQRRSLPFFGPQGRHVQGPRLLEPPLHRARKGVPSWRHHSAWIPRRR